MKVVILAGGLPSSLSDDKIPKPMLKVGERPLLWHIMKLFSMYGYEDFIICTGYRSEMIKEYFLNYYIYRSDITVELDTNNIHVHRSLTESWNVTVVDTGLASSTAKRIKIIESYLGNEDFIVTYGDCISDIDIEELTKRHTEGKCQMTVALAKPTGRNAIVPINQAGLIEDIYHSEYIENEAWTNMGIILVSPSVFSFIDEGTYDRFEIETIRKVASNANVGTYKHKGFWTPVETVRDHIDLETKWNNRELPWRD